MMLRPPLAAPPRTGSMLEPPTSESPDSTDWTACTPEDSPWVVTVRASWLKYPSVCATAMSDCEKATFRPGSDTLIEAGCSCPALGAGGGGAELEPPQATTRRPTPSNGTI